ncbi:MAG: hypothetical protein V1863_01770 [Candidatus Omnitrophota bacterium]
MKKQFVIFAIFLKGFTAVAAQTLLIRELLIVFYGNELTFGLMLCLWLLGGAFGSAVLGRFFQKARSPLVAYAFIQFFLGLSLPLALIVLRNAKSWLGIPFGEILNLGPILLVTLAALFLPAAGDGALFSVGFRLVEKLVAKSGSPMAKIYSWECLGIVVGGILSAFVFLTFFDAFQIAALLVLLNAVSMGLLLLNAKPLFLRRIPWLLCLGAVVFLVKAPVVQQKTLNKQWQNKNLFAYKNSIYGNIAVTAETEQKTLFYDGVPLVSIPDPDTYFTQDFIHLPMLAKMQARRVLFVGNALGGLLSETLKYPIERIVYAQIDPVLVKTIRSLQDPLTDRELDDPRVQVVLTDGRNFVKHQKNAFDIIFVNVGLPTSLAVNRYNTQEFFKEIKGALKSDGVVVFKTWGALSALSPELKLINASLGKTLQSVFDSLAIIPGDGFNLFLASTKPLVLDPNVLTIRLKTLDLKTSLINPAYLKLRLDPDYRAWLDVTIKDQLPKVSINTDLKPTAVYHGLSLYYAQFSKKIPLFLSGVGRAKPLVVFAVIVALLFFLKIFATSAKTKTALLSFTVISTGAFAMSIQIIVMFLFQSFFGSLFQWLAILTTSFMAGSALAALYANAHAAWIKKSHNLILVEGLLPLCAVALLFAAIAAFRLMLAPDAILKWLFSGVCLCTGGLVGLELPMIYEVFKQEEVSQGLAGKVYGLDLLGACFGALVTPLVLIPGCGIVAAVILLLFLKMGNAGNLFLAIKH